MLWQLAKAYMRDVYLAEESKSFEYIIYKFIFRFNNNLINYLNRFFTFIYIIFKFILYYILTLLFLETVWSWASSLTTLCFSFLLY